jgi:hypothetical protein
VEVDLHVEWSLKLYNLNEMAWQIFVKLSNIISYQQPLSDSGVVIRRQMAREILVCAPQVLKMHLKWTSKNMSEKVCNAVNYENTFKQ